MGPAICFSDLQDTPTFERRWNDLETQADGLTQRSLLLRKAAARYVDALAVVGQEQGYLAEALDEFCSAADEESVHIGCPLLKNFVHLFADLKDEHLKLGDQVKALLVDVVEIELEGCLYRDVKDAKKAFGKAEAEASNAQTKYKLQKHVVSRNQGEHLQESAARMKSTSEGCRIELAKRVNKWEHVKQHFFLNSFMQVAHAHTHFFQTGCNIMTELAGFVEDIRGRVLSRQAVDVDSSCLMDALAERHMHDYAERQLRIAAAEANVASSAALSETISHGPLQMTNQQVELAAEISTYMQQSHTSESSHIVTVLKQGYLQKKASGRMGQWQRRWFILQSDGTLYHWSKSGEVRKAVVNLQISTIKSDNSEHARNCSFSLVSPSHSYYLQADNELDRREWIDVIQAVIAWLLNNAASVAPPEVTPTKPRRPTHSRHSSQQMPGAEFSDQLTPSRDAYSIQSGHMSYYGGHNGDMRALIDSDPSDADTHSPRLHERVAQVSVAPPALTVLQRLRLIPGNTHCADCGALGPEWASLNLASLICIDCSGTHRQLGVHISKVRSTTLDIQVWEPNMIAMFEALGNEMVNMVYENRVRTSRSAAQRDDVFFSPSHHEDDGDDSSLLMSHSQVEEVLQHASPTASSHTAHSHPSVPGQSIPGSAHKHPASFLNVKPGPSASAVEKKEYIVQKYQHRAFVKQMSLDDACTHMWNSVIEGYLPGVQAALASGADIADCYDCPATRNILRESDSRARPSRAHPEPPSSEGPVDPDVHPGVGILHVAVAQRNLPLIEFIWQHCSSMRNSGEVMNAVDAYGRTPLHYCMLYEGHTIASTLVKRGAAKSIVDARGATPLEVAIDRGRLADEHLFLLLSEDTT